MTPARLITASRPTYVNAGLGREKIRDAPVASVMRDAIVQSKGRFAFRLFPALRKKKAAKWRLWLVTFHFFHQMNDGLQWRIRRIIRVALAEDCASNADKH